MDTTLLGFEPRLRLATFIGVLAVMVLWETLAPYRLRQQPRFMRWSGNLGILVLGTVLVRLLIPFAPVGAAALAATRGWGLFNILQVPAWTAFAISFLALDLVIYAQHRVMHRLPLLWRLHRMHHTDLELDATTGLRFHPFEITFSLALKIAAILALGAPPVAVMVFEIVLNASSLFNHGNVRMPANLEAALRLMIVTPLMHRVHHSAAPMETDSNFGFNFSWWDRLFASYRAAPAAGYEHMTIGLAAFRDPTDNRLDRLLAQPFKSAK